MNLYVRYPSIALGGSTEEQLRDIQSYLYQLTDTLNACDTSALSVMNEISEAINAGSAAGAAPNSETARRMQEYASLRDLIIKTADYAAGRSESIAMNLDAKYVAISDFGTYFENATVDIEGTPYSITQIYTYAAGIDTYAQGVLDYAEGVQDYAEGVQGYAEGVNAAGTDYRVAQENYIKTGLLYYDTGVPVYGVGVGKIYGSIAVYEPTTDSVINHAKTYYTRTGTSPDYTYTPVEEPVQADIATYYERVMSHETGQIYSTFTADEIAFWSGGTKLAYMTSSAMNFPNAHITGGSIDIGGTLLGGPAFHVNSSGELTAAGADISGAITATSGKVGGWTIDGNTLYAGASATSTTSYVGLSADSNDTYAIWAGDYRPANAEFSVTRAGALKATSGKIAGWTISGNRLQNSSGTIYLDGSTGYISGATIDGGSLNGVSGTFAGNLSGSTISVGGGYGYLYAGTNTSGTTAFEVYGTNGLRLITPTSRNIYISNNNGFIQLSGTECMFAAYLRPTTTNTYSLGTSSYRWSEVWCSAGGINTTSDRNVKKDIDYDLATYEQFFDSLRPCSYKFIDGTSGRTHIGMISQDVEDDLLTHGMTGTDFGGFLKDEMDGEPLYGLRYGEFIGLAIDQIQKLKQRVAALEARTGGLTQ